MTDRERRAVVVGTILIGLIVAVRVAPAAVEALRAGYADAGRRRVVLAQTAALLEQREAVQESLATALAAYLDLAPRLLAGGTPAAAGAALSSHVSALAEQHRLYVERLEVVRDSALGVFAPVALRASFEGDIAGVVQLLLALETSVVLTSVRELVISAADPVPYRGRPERLRLDVLVRGWYLPGEEA